MREVTERVDSSDGKLEEEIERKETSAFEVERVARCYSRQPRHYTSTPCIPRLHRMSVCEISAHFWKLGREDTDMRSKVDYMDLHGTHSDHPG